MSTELFGNSTHFLVRRLGRWDAPLFLLSARPGDVCEQNILRLERRHRGMKSVILMAKLEVTRHESTSLEFVTFSHAVDPLRRGRSFSDPRRSLLPRTKHEHRQRLNHDIHGLFSIFSPPTLGPTLPFLLGSA